jgi:hypothetical protein
MGILFSVLFTVGIIALILDSYFWLEKHCWWDAEHDCWWDKEG